MSAISNAADTLAQSLETCMTFDVGMDPCGVLDTIARHAIARAARAVNRTGEYATETTSREIEDACFLASVAQDAIDGTHRPSVGDVRAYVLRTAGY